MVGNHQLSISVAVRVRPFTEGELRRLAEHIPAYRSGDTVQLAAAMPSVLAPAAIRRVLRVADDEMLVFDPVEGRDGMRANPRAREYRFMFDRLLDESCSQAHAYETTTRPLVDAVLDGYNSTVFAYGATGCGKTHTILGPEQDPGVVFLATRDLFERVSLQTLPPTVTMSYLEIYNETVRDLLQPETPPNRLVIRENAGGKMTVANLASHTPANVDDVMELISAGNHNRTSAATDANEASSRSHAVLQLTITSNDDFQSTGILVTSATLTFVDLAGSERAAASSNRGQRLAEGANINRSLLALGNCINALCDPRRHKHVPYRDSKLTRLLKFSLGGNCRTVMIACVLPLSHHYDETLNTLKYADRAKHISTKAVRNTHTVGRHVSTLQATIVAQQRELNRLRTQISQNSQPSVRRAPKTAAVLQHLWEKINALVDDRKRKCILLAKRLVLFRHRLQAQFLVEKSQQNGGFNDNYGDRLVLSSLVATIDTAIAQLEALYSQGDSCDEIFHFASLVDAIGEVEEADIHLHRTAVLLAQQTYCGAVVQKASVFLESVLCAFPQLVCTNGELDFTTEFINMVLGFVGGKHDKVIDEHANWFFAQPQHRHFDPLAALVSPQPLPQSRRRKSVRILSAEKRVRWDVSDDRIEPSDFTVDELDVGSPKAPTVDELDLSFDPSLNLPPLVRTNPDQLNKLAVSKVRKNKRIPLVARRLPTGDLGSENNTDSIEEAVSLTPMNSPPGLGPPTRVDGS